MRSQQLSQTMPPCECDVFCLDIPMTPKFRCHSLRGNYSGVAVSSKSSVDNLHKAELIHHSFTSARHVRVHHHLRARSEPLLAWASECHGRAGAVRTEQIPESWPSHVPADERIYNVLRQGTSCISLSSNPHLIVSFRGAWSSYAFNMPQCSLRSQRCQSSGAAIQVLSTVQYLIWGSERMIAGLI